MIGSTKLASAAVTLMLTLPAAALAQPAPSPSGTAAPALPAATAPSPQTAPAAPVTAAERRVAQHIKELHAQLQITPAEEPQWQEFAAIMRENAKDMDQAFTQRAQQYPTMNAVQNMQSYAKIADDHAQRVQKLVPAFETLYNAMPEQQRQTADQVFRANAAAHARKHMQTGRSEAR